MRLQFFSLALLIVAIEWFWVSPTVAANPGVARTGSDKWIEVRVKSIYDKDERVDLKDVKVSSQDGKILLVGTVLTEYERAHAARLAGDVEGVKEVVNHIGVVEPINENFTLAKAVRAQILQNPALEVEKLRVSVEGFKEATIYGIVPSREQKRLVMDVAREVPGVERVLSEIEVIDES